MKSSYFHFKGYHKRLLRAMDNADIIVKSAVGYIQMSYMCGCKVLKRNDEGEWEYEICALKMMSGIWGEHSSITSNMRERGHTSVGLITRKCIV